jgi:hypothetical protein
MGSYASFKWVWYTLTFVSKNFLIKLDDLKCLTALQPLAFHHKALHVVLVSFPIEYAMCSYLLFYIASTPSGSCSDGDFEDYPGVFDEF